MPSINKSGVHPKIAKLGLQFHTRFRKSVLVVACMFLVLLPGCAQLPMLAPTEPATIQFAYGGGGTAYYKALIDEFNKEYPHITVELVNWHGRPPANIAEVDVFAISTYRFAYLQEKHILTPLNTFIQEDSDFDLNDFYPSTVNAFSIEGQRWAIPIGADTLVMYYNKTLFDKTNTPYPEPGWTWDDFLNRAINVSNSAAGVFGYAYHTSGGLGILEPMTFIYQHGGRLFDDLGAPTRMTLNDPLNVEAMTWYGDLINAHHVAPRPGERSLPFPENGIEKGQYAMWMGWYSDEREAHWGIAPLPRDQNACTMGSIAGLAIAAETPNPEASWQWVSFLSRQAPNDLIPARRSITESNAYRERVGSDNAETGRAALAELLQLNLSLEGQLGMTWGKSMGALSTALTMIRGGENAQAALDAAQEQSGF